MNGLARAFRENTLGKPMNSAGPDFPIARAILANEVWGQVVSAPDGTLSRERLEEIMHCMLKGNPARKCSEGKLRPAL